MQQELVIVKASHYVIDIERDKMTMSTWLRYYACVHQGKIGRNAPCGHAQVFDLGSAGADAVRVAEVTDFMTMARAASGTLSPS